MGLGVRVWDEGMKVCPSNRLYGGYGGAVSSFLEVSYEGIGGLGFTIGLLW